ncbi:MAG: monovalent cation/H(+) antiporter subunit G [Proteobacteria bacterium]|nr:monovalent cation/H(+) antiporter subunit G [Pseudomonadota bacterium]
MDIRIIITALCLIIGCFFIFVSAIGIVRFPDFFSRMHPAGKADTMGQTMVLIGLMVYEGFTLVSVKLLFIIIFIFIANPTATHALANAAYNAGIKPWKKGDRRK